jgi:hypothetical protein
MSQFQFIDNDCGSGTEVIRKSEQYVLTLPLKTNFECVVPILRADTEETLIAIIENESLIDTETNKADWIKGSQLEAFIHPSTVIEQGYNPIPLIRLEDWYTTMRKTIDQQWDAQVMTIPQHLACIPTADQHAETAIVSEAANEASA